MPITDVELTDTFDSWRIKTNQIIQQSNQAFNISISSFEYSNNALNNVVIIASNVTANIVSQNTYLIGAVSNNVIVAVNQNVENIIVSNTLIRSSITDSANDYALLFFSTNSLGQTWTTANYAYIHANAAHVHANAAFDKANTGGTISYQAYDQANTANITADAAYNQANAARIHANSGFDTANAANQYAFAAIIQANTGRDHANASFGRANAALSNAAIGVANNYAYTGNLYVISNFYVPTANVVLGRLSDSTVGQGVKLDIAGAANASQYYISGNMVTAMTNSYTQLVGAASNTWSNTIFGYSNTKFMVNTTATFAGSLTTTGTISDSIGNVRVIPVNTQSSAYVLQASDIGKFISISSGGVTVPVSVFKAGDAISIYNNSGTSQTITQGVSVTMYLAGTATLGNRTLAQRGIATVLCVGVNEFVISGSGLT